MSHDKISAGRVTVPLKDYVYFDEKRLNSYVEQIGSPEKTIKVPKWSFKLGITGPEVKGEQEQVSTARTQTEKIEMVLGYLRKHGELAEGRIHGRDYFNYPPELRLETCWVLNVGIPSQDAKASGPDAMTLWVSSDASSDLSRLFLLQDYRKDDEDGFGAHSAYSSLLLIYQEVLSRVRKYDPEFVSELRSREMKRLGRTSYRGDRELEMGSLGKAPLAIPDLETIANEVDRRVDAELDRYFPLLNPLDADVQKRFAIDPVAILGSMGARVGGRKYVETLYRVREVHMEPLPQGHFATITFGYPIFIAAL